MNILFINNLYGADSVGGAEEVVRTRAERWASEGHCCFVLSSQKQKGITEHRDSGTRVRHVAIRPNNICWYKDLSKHSFFYRLVWHTINLFDSWTAKRIIKFCHENNIERVETHNLVGISMQVPRYLRKARIEHHHYLHDVQLVEPSGILPADHTRESLAQRLYSFFVRRAFGSPSVVYSPTRFLKEFYEKRGFFAESEWKVEHEDLTYHKTHITRQSAHSKRYLFVGTLVEHKGVRELLEAWKKHVSRDTQHISLAPEQDSLTIVGDGPLRTLVEDAAEQDSTITYFGRVPHEDIAEIYARHDVLAFPSQCIENRPNVVAEAMAHGLEIIAVETGGVAEMVKEYERVTRIDPKEHFTL